jgi:hypothetical protein
MPYDLPFSLFQDDSSSPLWRRDFADLEEAKRHARRLADEERLEFFVLRLEDFSEVARLFPSRHKAGDLHPDSARHNDSAESTYAELMKTVEGTPEYCEALGNFILCLFPDCDPPTTVLPEAQWPETPPGSAG